MIRPTASRCAGGLVLAVLVAVTACARATPDERRARTVTEPAVMAAGDLRAERVVADLAGPTQMVFGPDGRVWVAQLNGGEDDGRGQVLAVDLDGGERELLLDGLDKPTGIAWLDGSLWIATRDAVLRARGDPPGEPEVVVAGLPSNGRSNGTLTPTPDGRLLYETSGRLRRNGGVVERSGTLWELDPADPDDPTVVATGFKNAYAHVFDGSGALWSTEIAEPIGGAEPPDELNRIERGADYGWPACVGDRRPVESVGVAAEDQPDVGGDPQRCEDTVAPVAEFGPGATATSVVVSPFDDDAFIVALWMAGEVVSVAADGSGEPTALVEGLARPQHLLTDGHTLLVSDHARGTIHRITADRSVPPAVGRRPRYDDQETKGRT
jgi:glucose/arabinose dehydrogenase